MWAVKAREESAPEAAGPEHRRAARRPQRRMRSCWKTAPPGGLRGHQSGSFAPSTGSCGGFLPGPTPTRPDAATLSCAGLAHASSRPRSPKRPSTRKARPARSWPRRPRRLVGRYGACAVNPLSGGGRTKEDGAHHISGKIRQGRGGALGSTMRMADCRGPIAPPQMLDIQLSGDSASPRTKE